MSKSRTAPSPPPVTKECWSAVNTIELTELSWAVICYNITIFSMSQTVQML